jgi:hypothetical protein
MECRGAVQVTWRGEKDASYSDPHENSVDAEIQQGAEEMEFMLSGFNIPGKAGTESFLRMTGQGSLWC